MSPAGRRAAVCQQGGAESEPADSLTRVRWPVLAVGIDVRRIGVEGGPGALGWGLGRPWGQLEVSTQNAA